MLRDVEFFKTKLQHIDGFGDTGDYLTDIIKSKQVKSASPSPPPVEAVKDEKTALGQGFDAPEKKPNDDDEAKKEPVGTESGAKD